MAGRNQTILPRKKTMLARQRAFIENLPLHGFNITRTCKKLSISRARFYEWRDNDPKFREQYEAVTEAQLDEWEECLHRNIKSGSEASVIFGLKTRGKGRGYVEKESGNSKVAKLLEDVLAGTITPREAAYKINAMGLPLPEVLRIELGKAPPEEPETGAAPSVEELERRAQEAMESINRERETFVPERRSEVEEIKRELAHVDSFSPKNKGDSYGP